jgi:hypothetical protein
MQSESQELDDTTRKHISRLSDALAFAPGLAALHATRNRLLTQAANTSERSHLGAETHQRCLRCGSSGIGQIRVQRITTRRRSFAVNAHKRVVRWICEDCQFVKDTPLDLGTGPVNLHNSQEAARIPAALYQPSEGINLAIVQSVDHGSAIANPTKTPVTIVKGPSSNTAHPHSSAMPAQKLAGSNPRSKQKSSLQALLARNREREAQDASKQAQSGLGAFLNSL